MAVLRKWNPKVVHDNSYHYAVGTDWQSLQCSLAVLVVWFVSHRTSILLIGALLKLLNSKDINKFIMFNINIYYGQHNCALIGYYEGRSVNFLPTSRNNLLIPH